MSALTELAWLFLRLGTTAFGGPAAHIAMMRDEVVKRRAWLTDAEFLDLVGAANLVPGPTSTELAIHIGHKRGGMRGLLVAGACFIVPAALLTLAIAWVYVRYGSLPRAQGLLYGIKPVILAVIAKAIYGLARSAIKDVFLAAIGALSLGAIVMGAPELGVLAAAGGLAMARRVGPRAPLAFVPAPKVLVVFAKIGAVLFGSGYVLVAFLRAEIVSRGWITEAQLVDAIAVGQFTPGPLFTTATFVGYLISGVPGALAATVGIFAPAFLFVTVSGFLVPWMRRTPRAAAFLDGVNVASLALMGFATWQIGRASLVDVPTVLMAAVTTLALFKRPINSAWLVLAGGIVGALLHARG